MRLLRRTCFLLFSFVLMCSRTVMPFWHPLPPIIGLLQNQHSDHFSSSNIPAINPQQFEKEVPNNELASVDLWSASLFCHRVAHVSSLRLVHCHFSACQRAQLWTRRRDGNSIASIQGFSQRCFENLSSKAQSSKSLTSVQLSKHENKTYSFTQRVVKCNWRW